MPHGQSAIRKVPTAYGDGLWGLQNTDITDAHGLIITDQLFLLTLFDGPLGLRILNGFLRSLLSCLPQISQICTDAFHVQPAKESVLIRRAGGASKTKQ